MNKLFLYQTWSSDASLKLAWFSVSTHHQKKTQSLSAKFILVCINHQVPLDWLENANWKQMLPPYLRDKYLDTVGYLLNWYVCKHELRLGKIKVSILDHTEVPLDKFDEPCVLCRVFLMKNKYKGKAGRGTKWKIDRPNKKQTQRQARQRAKANWHID